jgi:methionyl aminopeptidase
VIPANIGYYGYTKTTCISPNEVVCHGIPSKHKVLNDGDIINIDVAIIKDGYFGDTSRMYYVGTVKLKQKISETTYEAMVAGIHMVKPGATLGYWLCHSTVGQREGYRLSVNIVVMGLVSLS